jgi:flavin-dependent dehydrogenase
MPARLPAATGGRRAYDAIVVGARCAGSPTAMLLARKGYRVLLLDRVTFPSDTMRNHYIHRPGVVRLKRWGLLDQVAASNCPPIRQQTLDLGDFPLTRVAEPADGVDADYAPRRFVLDKILVDAAVAAGAELREGFTVQEVLAEDGRVVGIRGRWRGGAAVEERARIVVGADGLHSLVARSVQAPIDPARPSCAFTYYSYFGDVPIAGLEGTFLSTRVFIAFPTNDELACIAVEAPIAEFPTFRADIEGSFFRSLDLVPGLADRVRAGRRAERWFGTADLPNFFRKPYGPGWALVGDAGYHKDPITAQGISDAFRDAELLAEAIDDEFAGRRPLEEALADYERRRNEAAWPLFEEACARAAFTPFPAEAYAARAARRVAP